MSNRAKVISDEELVERFKEGDRAVFDILVERHARRAFQIAFGVVGNRQDAEEIAQDSFVRIHKNLHKFRGDSLFTTWMYRIVKNLAKNKYRWNKSRRIRRNLSIDAPLRNEDGSELYFDLPETGMSPDEEASLAEFEKRVIEELNNLPEIYREAISLRNTEKLSYEAIAEIIGCKVGTVKSRIARARQELRKRLDL